MFINAMRIYKCIRIPRIEIFNLWHSNVIRIIGIAVFNAKFAPLPATGGGGISKCSE